MTLSCNQVLCAESTIERVVFAVYGSVFGDCPNYLYTHRCVREVPDIVYDTCKDEEECEFEVKKSKFKGTKVTSPFPDIRTC